MTLVDLLGEKQSKLNHIRWSSIFPGRTSLSWAQAGLVPCERYLVRNGVSRVYWLADVPTKFPSRLNLRWLLGLFMTLLLTVLACAAPVAVPNTKNVPTFQPSVEPPVRATPVDTGEMATVTNIVDGDTIDVRLNVRTERIRYIGMDTPEHGRRRYRFFQVALAPLQL
jgi:hypothetical protein